MNNRATEEMFKKLDACVHCGMCLTACPTYQVTGSEAESPRGRLYLMREFYEGKLSSPQQLAKHLDLCLGCLACATACPSGVDYSMLLSISRERLLKTQPFLKRFLRRFIFRHILTNTSLLYVLKELLWFYQYLGFKSIIRKSGITRFFGQSGKLESLLPTVQKGKPLSYGSCWGENKKGRVALFVGCIMNTLYSSTHLSTIRVLVKNGYEVFIPEQTCCGALAHHSGETDIARELAEKNVKTIMSSNPDWIVVNAAGCGSTLKEYDHLLGDYPQGKQFSKKVVDILELLAREPLEGELSPVALNVTYQAACHLHHAQKIQKEPYKLLEQIPGLKVVPLTEAETCCGSAGVYNIAHPDLSLSILKEKMRYIAQTDADMVMVANPGCMLQLEAGTRCMGLSMKILHPVDLIAMAYSYEQLDNSNKEL